ncbi:hypothetical protein [Saccharopolyspora elongata]|uniref:Uncharacterized protein n=1 Tax=Saccharopolyspora elongata TaxID=2530387 RepID=A0A4R4Y0B2_9PSEU|nr:hypothetical protein [Saccharopolyspora elongata]TDD36799.1 hypothetical protein E1288_41375 [Saccharopolyspora elongata]
MDIEESTRRYKQLRQRPGIHQTGLASSPTSMGLVPRVFFVKEITITWYVGFFCLVIGCPLAMFLMCSLAFSVLVESRGLLPCVDVVLSIRRVGVAA